MKYRAGMSSHHHHSFVSVSQKAQQSFQNCTVHVKNVVLCFCRFSESCVWLYGGHDAEIGCRTCTKETSMQPGKAGGPHQASSWTEPDRLCKCLNPPTGFASTLISAAQWWAKRKVFCLCVILCVIVLCVIVPNTSTSLEYSTQIQLFCYCGNMTGGCESRHCSNSSVKKSCCVFKKSVHFMFPTSIMV